MDYRFVVEIKREKAEIKKLEDRKARIAALQEKDRNWDGGIIYGIGHNFMLRRIVDGTMHRMYNWYALRSMMFGNKLIFDCSFHQYMNQQEERSCVKQIVESLSINRIHDNPFDIYLCNADPAGFLINKLHVTFPNMFDDDFPLTVTSKSYLEIFNRDELVYLTSDAPQMMEEYDPSKVYIIGSYVDKVRSCF